MTLVDGAVEPGLKLAQWTTAFVSEVVMAHYDLQAPSLLAFHPNRCARACQRLNLRP